MATLTRWLAPAVIAAGLGMVGLSPATARAQSGDDWVRVLVDIADVIYHSGYPYYRYDYGDYGARYRLIVVRDRYGRPNYYRYVPRDRYQYGPPYGNAYGYRRHHRNPVTTRCDRYGRCYYYDSRYDRRYDNRYYRYDRDDRYDRYDRSRYWDGVRWRYRDYDD